MAGSVRDAQEAKQDIDASYEARTVGRRVDRHSVQMFDYITDATPLLFAPEHSRTYSLALGEQTN